MYDYSITLTQGRTFQRTVTVGRYGSAENIAGASFVFTAKYDLRDSDAAAVFSCGNGDGISIVSAPAGEFSLTIVPGKTSGLPVRQEPLVLKYELIYLPSTGEKWTLLTGNLTIIPRTYQG